MSLSKLDVTPDLPSDPDDNVHNANVDNANVDNANVDNANVDNANGDNVDNANVGNANVDNANVDNVDNANVDNANVDNANVHNANVHNATVDNDLMNNLLMNKVALGLIFGKLDIPDLRTVRLVCSAWRDSGASTLMSKAWLDLEKLIPCDVAMPTEVLPPIPDALLERIFIQHGRENAMVVITRKCGRRDHPHFLANCMNLLPRMDEFTTSLHLHIGDWCGTQLIRALATGHLLALKWACVKFMYGGNQDGRMLRDGCQNWVVRPALTYLSLILGNYYGPMRTDGDMASMAKGFIGAGINLTVLSVEATFYPDLTNCSKLEEFSYVFLKDGCQEEISISSVNRMLAGLPDSVKKLDLDYFEMDDGPNVARGEALKLRLPRPMPNLTSLNVRYGGSVFRIDNMLKLGQLPTLERLWIGLLTRQDWGNDIFTRAGNPHVGVTSLDLACASFTQNSDAIRRIVALFPALKQLEFRLIVVSGLNGQNFGNFASILKALDGWVDLTSGTVTLERVDSPNLPAVLQDWATLEVSKNVKLITLKDTWRSNPTELPFSTDLKEALEACKTCKSVVLDYKVSDAVKNEMLEFFRTQELPISFK